MKITIQTDASVQETPLNITCREITPELERLIEALRVTDKKLSVKVNGEIRLIDLKAILYVETVERCTFIYTEDGVFETSLRLYELEAMLAEHNFFRINKSTLLNLNKIESLKSDIYLKIRVRIKNGYQLIISRTYSEEFISKIGVR